MSKQKLIEDVSDETNRERLRSFIETFSAHLSKRSEDPKFARQLQRIAKKADMGTPGLADKAFSDFLDVNRIAGSVNITLDDNVIGDARLFITVALERYFQNIGSPQCEFDLSTILTNWRFGPGSSRLTRATHFFEKLSEKSGSCSKVATPFAVLLRKLNPHLRALDGVRPYEFKECNASTMSSVRKNEDTDRTICTEPLWNMAIQLAAGSAIEGALRAVGLDISEQPIKNRRLAYKGSLDDSLCTIDLKSASDLITPALIKLLWPASWYSFFMQIRSSHTIVGGWHVKLNMMSTMGNGFTFPMMTLTLLALVYAVCSKKHMHVDYSQIGVFGDDIICPVKDFNRLCNVLQDAGLIVNLDKSYRSGPFRESCGGDYYNGKYITPFYVKSLRNDAEVYQTINGLLEWAWDLGDANHLVPHTSLDYLISLLDRPLLVPFWSAPTEGIRSITVRRRYKAVVEVKKHRFCTQDSSEYEVFLLAATGGYVRSAGDRLTWTPRCNKTSWRICEKKIPKGFSNGGTVDNSAGPCVTMESWIDSALCWLLPLG